MPGDLCQLRHLDPTTEVHTERAISTSLPGKLEPTALKLLFSDRQRHHLNNMITCVRGDDTEYGLCRVVHLARPKKVTGLGFPGRAPVPAVMPCNRSILFSHASAPS